MKPEEIANLVSATGLSAAAVARMLDTDERSLARWLTGERKPRHPAMLKKALQLIILEQQGIITARLVTFNKN